MKAALARAPRRRSRFAGSHCYPWPPERTGRHRAGEHQRWQTSGSTRYASAGQCRGQKQGEGKPSSWLQASNQTAAPADSCRHRPENPSGSGRFYLARKPPPPRPLQILPLLPPPARNPSGAADFTQTLREAAAQTAADTPAVAATGQNVRKRQILPRPCAKPPPEPLQILPLQLPQMAVRFRWQCPALSVARHSVWSASHPGWPTTMDR